MLWVTGFLFISPFNVRQPFVFHISRGTVALIVIVMYTLLFLFAGSGAMYDATAFASFTDVVVVTINYRLGVLGMFCVCIVFL